MVKAHQVLCQLTIQHSDKLKILFQNTHALVKMAELIYWYQLIFLCSLNNIMINLNELKIIRVQRLSAFWNPLATVNEWEKKTLVTNTDVCKVVSKNECNHLKGINYLLVIISWQDLREIRHLFKVIISIFPLFFFIPATAFTPKWKSANMNFIHHCTTFFSLLFYFISK